MRPVHPGACSAVCPTPNNRRCGTYWPAAAARLTQSGVLHALWHPAGRHKPCHRNGSRRSRSAPATADTLSCAIVVAACLPYMKLNSYKVFWSSIKCWNLRYEAETRHVISMPHIRLFPCLRGIKDGKIFSSLVSVLRRHSKHTFSRPTLSRRCYCNIQCARCR